MAISTSALRSTAMAVGAVGQVVAPALGSLAGLPSVADVSRRHPALITPPGPFFGVWGPIFAACGVAAVRQALPGHHDDEASRRTSGPLATAYLGNAAWEILSTTGPYAATPVLLAGSIVAPTGRAYRALQSLDDAEAPSALVVATGLLLGWTSVATVVNVASALGLRAGRRGAAPLSAVALLGTGVAVSEVVRRSRRGGLAVAASATWGLVGAAAGARSSWVVRVAGIAAAGLVVEAARRSMR